MRSACLFAIGLAIAGTPAPACQDDLEKQVRELAAQLEEDSLEARDAASEKLIALSPEALPYLRKARATAGSDAVTRLDEAIAKIESRVKLGEAMGKPALVTLKAEARPLGEVMADIAKQSGRAIEVGKEVANETVTVAIEGLPFWAALETVCRGHGGIVWNSLPEKIEIQKRPHPAVPWIHEQAQALFLTEVGFSRTIHQTGSYSDFYLSGLAAFEKGKAPVRIRWNMRTMKDDKGRELLSPDERGGGYFQLGQAQKFDDSGLGNLSYRQTKLPPDDARKIAELSGDVEYIYALGMEEAKVEAPWKSGQTSVKLGDLSMTFSGYGMQSRYLYWSANLQGKGDLKGKLEYLTCEAYDKDGKIVGYVNAYMYSGTMMQFNYWDRDENSPKPVGVLLRRPSGVGHHRMRFTFKDIDLK